MEGVTIRSVELVGLLSIIAGCGRTGVRKNGGSFDGGTVDVSLGPRPSDSSPVADMAQPADLPTDAISAADSPIHHPADALNLSDSLRPTDSLSLSACTALQPLATQGLLTSRRTKKVLFTHDRSAVVLQVRSEADAAAGDDVLERIK